MKVKVLRSLGTTLVAELNKNGLPCPTNLLEGAEVDVPDQTASELVARGLVEIKGEKPKDAPK